MSESLYYLLTLLATLLMIAGIMLYLRRQYRLAIRASVERFGSISYPLTIKARTSYIAALVLIVFLFPANLYLWHTTRQREEVVSVIRNIKRKYIFYTINLTTAMLFSWSFYVMNISTSMDQNMKALDVDGFYLSALDTSKMTYIDSFLMRATSVGLTEKKARGIRSAVKDFEHYVFSYRRPTGYTDQPFLNKYKDAIAYVIRHHKESFGEKHPDIRLPEGVKLSKEALSAIIRLSAYAPEELYWSRDDSDEYLDAVKIERWGNNIIESILGDDIHIISSQQTIRENFFLVFRYRPLSFLLSLLPLFGIALLINIMLGRIYFELIERYPALSEGSPGHLVRGTVSFVVMAILLGIITLFLHLGDLLDSTQRPIRSDLIVSLGGSPERLHRSLALYREGYSRSGQILLTGNTFFVPDDKATYYHNKIAYLVKQGISPQRITHAEATENTMEELLAIKAFMRRQGHNSVLIVADPPHSRRIMTMARALAGFEEEGIDYRVVSSEVLWWDKEHYYEDAYSLRFVLNELIKLPFNLIRYGIIRESVNR